jgi:hypothetical protein
MSRLSVLVLALGLAGCAAQLAGGATLDDDGPAAVGTVDFRLQDLRNDTWYLASGFRSRFGDQGAFRLQSVRVAGGRTFRLGVVSPEAGIFMSYGVPPRASFGRPGYELGLEGALAFRAWSTEDRRESVAVLLSPLDVVLLVDAGRWWGSRLDYQATWVFTAQLGLRMSFHSDLLFNPGS